MRILIATALYPPDVAYPAHYTKELATVLAHEHTCTLLCYGYIPEEVEKVELHTVRKDRWLLLRVAHFTIALLRHSKNADIILLQNGPSVDLPGLILTFFSKKPVVVIESDQPSKERARSALETRLIYDTLLERAAETISTTPPPQPEKHPFNKDFENEYQVYTNAWNAHLEEVHNVITHHANK